MKTDYGIHYELSEPKFNYDYEIISVKTEDGESHNLRQWLETDQKPIKVVVKRLGTKEVFETYAQAWSIEDVDTKRNYWVGLGIGAGGGATLWSRQVHVTKHED